MKKVVYLFGAGATHAEILNLEDNASENFLSKNGLKISSVSKRVMNRAQNSKKFKEYVEEVTYRKGNVNIELLISLFESNQIPDVDFKVKHLKKLIENDIQKILSSDKKRKFYLHKALFELHSLIHNKETLTGVISLNYDDVLDLAYKTIHGNAKPNYCHTSEGEGKKQDIPLLKLHGSFNWININSFGKIKNIPIIPFGINKNYLMPPYNFIWSRAFEILAQCDILRIIGCSLSQNDIGLIDLLFKAHLERKGRFSMEIINMEDVGQRNKNNYGFFPAIKTFDEIEDGLISEHTENKDSDLLNPFRIWLKAKALRMVKKDLNKTKYLKKCL